MKQVPYSSNFGDKEGLAIDMHRWFDHATVARTPEVYRPWLTLNFKVHLLSKALYENWRKQRNHPPTQVIYAPCSCRHPQLRRKSWMRPGSGHLRTHPSTAGLRKEPERACLALFHRGPRHNRHFRCRESTIRPG
jgi:hypothetical protein